MKKLLTVLAILVAVASLNAQTTFKVSKNTNTVEFNGDVTGIVDAATESAVVIFDLSDKNAVQYYALQVNVDSVSHAATDYTEYARTTLSGGYAKNGSYTNIDTVDFYGTDTDTTFLISDLSSGSAYPFLKLKVAGSDSLGVRLDDIDGRFLDK